MGTKRNERRDAAITDTETVADRFVATVGVDPFDVVAVDNATAPGVTASTVVDVVNARIAIDAARSYFAAVPTIDDAGRDVGTVYERFAIRAAINDAERFDDAAEPTGDATDAAIYVAAAIRYAAAAIDAIADIAPDGRDDRTGGAFDNAIGGGIADAVDRAGAAVSFAAARIADADAIPGIPAETVAAAALSVVPYVADASSAVDFGADVIGAGRYARVYADRVDTRAIRADVAAGRYERAVDAAAVAAGYARDAVRTIPAPDGPRR